MKKLIIIVFIFILSLSINVFATTGPVKQDSVIECNGIYYGKHGTPPHWHIATKNKDRWISVGDEVDIPSCYIKIPNERELVKFSKCSDGDTAWFIINGEEKKVRFLAIDTPEISDSTDPLYKYGKEASEYTCNILKTAKEIYLEYDGASDKEDKYGRVLAFIFVDGKFLEKELISNGLAKVAYIYGDYEHVDELRKEEEIAKKNSIGIWNDNLPDIIDDVEENKETEENILIEFMKIIIDIIKKIFAILFD